MTEDFLDEKWLLEEGAARALVDALNLHRSSRYVIVEHSDRPDLIIEDLNTGERLGVEVTHLFYDSEQAKMLFGRSAGSLEHSPEYIEEYIKRLNALLLQKAEKAKEYRHEYPLALLIRVVSPFFHTYDWQAHMASILVPPSDYKYIWLLYYDIEEKRWALMEELQANPDP